MIDGFIGFENILDKNAVIHILMKKPFLQSSFCVLLLCQLLWLLLAERICGTYIYIFEIVLEKCQKKNTNADKSFAFHSDSMKLQV